METEETAVFATEGSSSSHNPPPAPVDPGSSGSSGDTGSSNSGNSDTGSSGNSSGSGNSWSPDPGDSSSPNSPTMPGSSGSDWNEDSNDSGSSGKSNSSKPATKKDKFVELTEEDQTKSEPKKWERFDYGPAEETDAPESEIVEITIFEGFREPTFPAEEIPQAGETGGSAGWLLAGIGIVLVLVIGLVLARKKKRT